MERAFMSTSASPITFALPFVRSYASESPNLRAADSADSTNQYYKCAFVSFASIRRVSPGAELAFVTNEAPPERVRESFERLDVNVLVTPFSHRPPEGFSTSFSASLYALDAIASLDRDSLILIDPDVVFLRDIRPLVERLGTRIGAIEIPYPAEARINGLSRKDASKIHEELGLPATIPIHFGGEFYIFNRGTLPTVRKYAEVAWNDALDRYRKGQLKFTTEEHILSFALRHVEHVAINDCVDRIWTGYNFRRVPEHALDLMAWHLPAEKSRGFHRLLDAASDLDSWFWRAAEDVYIGRLGTVMGVTDRTARRRLLEGLGHGRRFIRELRVSRADRVHG